MDRADVSRRRSARREDASLVSPRTAFWITDILSDPEAREYIFGRGGSLEFPFPVAVKTGTSQAYHDNWTIGYSRHVTVGVWVGNFDRAPLRTRAASRAPADLSRRDARGRTPCRFQPASGRAGRRRSGRRHGRKSRRDLHDVGNGRESVVPHTQARMDRGRR